MNTFTKTICCLTLILFVFTIADGQSGPPGKSSDVTLQDLSWLVGYWALEDNGNVMVECWLAPRQGVMVGVHQDSYTSGKMLFEYLRIAETADGVVYYASPNGEKTTAFRLTSFSNEAGVKMVVFENPENEFPKLIRYSLDEEGVVLMAEVEGRSDGFNVSEAWTWYKGKFPE